jgi:serine phosphatase RsbU (regulator of sigma subunit)/Tfp pilus assembly protein PilF
MNMLNKLKYSKVLPFLFILSSAVLVCGQNTQVDSLENILKTTTRDTTRIKTLNVMADLVYRTDPNEAIKYGSDAKSLAEQINFREGLAGAYKNIGLGHYMQGNYKEAIQNWEAALGIYEALEDDQMVANIIGNIGSIYYTTGVNDLAIEYYLRALKIAEKLGDSKRIGTLLLNIGSVYSEQPATIDTALNYYLRAVKIGESIGYEDLLGLGSINLGQLYLKKGAYDSALVHFERSLDIVKGNIDIAASLNDIGKIYAEKGDFETAIKYHNRALDLAQKEQAQLETARILLGLASTYMKQGKPELAIQYYDKARAIAEEIGLQYELSDAYEGLAVTHADVKDYKNAYLYLSLQNKIDSAINRIETENRTSYLMFSYQLDKKESEIEILEQQSKIEQLASRRQRAIIIATGTLGLLLLLMAAGFYNRMQFIRKTNQKIRAQKDEIENQRDEIEAQRDQIQKQHDTVFAQKELITDSINYAQRIQSALLPSPALLDELIPEHFILFKPKDIVSGDFYWIKEVQDHLVIAGADCTGHGVPGAFMSMLGITLLNDLIGNRCFNAPSAILGQLRLKIKELLDQEGNTEEQKDGMDMVMAILDRQSRQLHFSGANNPLYVIRSKALSNGQQMEPYFSLEDDSYNLYELKGDKQPIGVHWEETGFTTHSIQLQEQDTFYIFSDGFVDQFGGENRKKFKALNFKKLLLSIQEEPMALQRQILEQSFEAWRGKFEQIDDVTVIGVRI